MANKASKPKQPDHADLLTRRQLADRLGKHPMTVTKWEQDGLPVAVRGRRGRPSLYDPTAVSAWCQARDEAAKQQAPDLLVARARKELAQAIEAEQRVAIRAGKLIAIEDVDRIWSAQVAAVRAQLLAIPTALADRLHRVAALEGVVGIETVLVDAMHAALRELADGGARPSPPRRRRAKTSTPTRPVKRGRVKRSP